MSKTTRKTAVSIGILLILQVVTAAIGLSSVQSFLAGTAGRESLTLGAALMMFSGALIATIGVLLYRVLRSTNQRLAIAILALRATEFAVAVAFGIYLLVNSQTVPNHLLWVYILAGSAGVIFSSLLVVSRLVPRPIAVLGLVGYLLLLIGVPLGFAGLIDTTAGVGQALIVPGAVFEVIVLPLWLFIRGFSTAKQTRLSVADPVLAR